MESGDRRAQKLADPFLSASPNTNQYTQIVTIGWMNAQTVPK